MSSAPRGHVRLRARPAVHADRAREGGDGIGPPREPLDLHLELMRQPFVVRVEEGQVLPSRRDDAAITGARDAFVLLPQIAQR